MLWAKNTFYPIGNKNVLKVRAEIGDHQACRRSVILVIVNELELVKLKETLCWASLKFYSPNGQYLNFWCMLCKPTNARVVALCMEESGCGA